MLEEHPIMLCQHLIQLNETHIYSEVCFYLHILVLVLILLKSLWIYL